MKLFKLVVAICALVSFNSAYSQSSPRQPDTGITAAEFEKIVMGLPTFNEIIKTWEQKAPKGNIAKMYDKMRVVKTFPAGKPKISPKKGDMYVYQVTGLSYDNPFQRPKDERITAKSIRVAVIDAIAKEVIAWNELPLDLKGNPHSSPVTGDGKYIYAGGPPLTNFEEVEFDQSKADNTGCTSPVCSAIPTTLVKIDTQTLEAVSVLTSPGRQHHGHVFRDDYMLLDTFIRDDDGVDTYILDPATDSVVAGMRAEELGGSPYTSWVDHDNQHIYQLMEPAGYGDRKVHDGYISAHWMKMNGVTALRPFCITKVKVSDDMKTWEVVKEYPYFSPDDKYMYITSGVRAIVTKISLDTGRQLWATPVGDGPYGVEITADGRQIWSANKGETTDMWGHDITIINAITGMREGLINTGWTTDHLILSPDGSEIWASANGSGKFYVYDVKTKEEKAVINMPGFGDPHGVPFVYYDEDGQGRLVVDQNGFHNGVDAQRGNPLIYQ
jgi:hypothetical protein